MKEVLLNKESVIHGRRTKDQRDKINVLCPDSISRRRCWLNCMISLLYLCLVIHCLILRDFLWLSVKEVCIEDESSDNGGSSRYCFFEFEELASSGSRSARAETYKNKAVCVLSARAATTAAAVARALPCTMKSRCSYLISIEPHYSTHAYATIMLRVWDWNTNNLECLLQW